MQTFKVGVVLRPGTRRPSAYVVDEQLEMDMHHQGVIEALTSQQIKAVYGGKSDLSFKLGDQIVARSEQMASKCGPLDLVGQVREHYEVEAPNEYWAMRMARDQFIQDHRPARTVTETGDTPNHSHGLLGRFANWPWPKPALELVAS